MIEPRYRWLFPDPVRPSPELREAAARHELPPFVAGLLARRGIADPDALDLFLGPPAAGLHDPRRLPDANRLLERIAAARAAGERVQVFGDFDADGLTGLAILVIALRRLGLDVDPYVPSRLDEGHGLSLAAVDAAAAADASVIVTVDTGSTSVAEVEAARRRGIDVIVTDHHRVPERTPPAYALVNPHRADSLYPDDRLSGAGVAFSVARLLLGELAQAEVDAFDLAELAVIGTVSDVAPVLGENRAIAKLGLERLRTTPRPGIAALLEAARVAPAKVDLDTIGFVLAPRLNAAGRVGEAIDAARLLLAETDAEAAELAARLEAANATRKDLMKVALTEARAAAGLASAPAEAAGTSGPDEAAGTSGPRPPAIVVLGEWPVGIVGLVAGRLADETGLPAVVGTVLGPLVRASCRGDGRLHLATALADCSDLLVRHGGHAAAAGFEVPIQHWPAFVERFTALAEASRPEDARPAVRVDLALPARYVDYRLLAGLRRLAPCGPGNPEPMVAVLGLTASRVREVAGGHTSLVLRRDRDVLDAIAFQRPDLALSIADGDRVDVLARVASRSFGGVESLQLEVRDVAPASWHAEIPAILERFAAGAARQPAAVADS